MAHGLAARAMAGRSPLRRLLGQALGPVAAVFLLLVALYLAADAEGLGARFARYYPWVFVASGAALVLLALAIVQRLLWLRRQLRRSEPGALLTRRLVLLLILIAVPPVVLVYVFGVRFVDSTVDSWLQANTAQAMENALALGRVFLNERLAQSSARTRTAAEALDGLEGRRLRVELEEALDEAGALQLAVLGEDGRSLAVAAARTDLLSADPPGSEALLALARRGHWEAVESADEGLRIRALRSLRSAPGEPRLLQALYELPRDYAALALEVEQAAHEQRRAAFLREALKLALTLILSFVLLLSLLLALLLAFELGRRLVRPIGELARATESLAAGRPEGPIDEPAADELGFLVRSFNRMVAELAEARAAEQASAQASERQRAELETVLGRLSSGVIALDTDGRLLNANPAAEAILGHALRSGLQRHLERTGESLPEIAPLCRLLLERLREGAQEWRDELRLTRSDGALRLILRGARLPDGGVVAVFDDSAELDRAQRDAAWGEVAKRLAHEIKNPLTPMQLAAERLRRRLLPKLDGEDAEVLERASGTVIAQVEALKAMVDAFSDYARPPPLRLVPLDAAALLAEVLELYAQQPRLSIACEIEPELPPLRADAGRLRQVLHNLIKNAIEAGEGRERLQLAIGLRRAAQSGRRGVELSIADDGPGLPEGFDAAWFDPYRSSKQRGTGLGLAIVRRIAEEHGGSLRAGPSALGGACFTLWLPA
jgi:nitrogen fixation/metabolism regulation signal transduction histidine kinase